MNKANAKQVSKLQTLTGADGKIQQDFKGYAARTLTAMHRCEGSKVQKEIEALIVSFGLSDVVSSVSGSLVCKD